MGRDRSPVAKGADRPTFPHVMWSAWRKMRDSISLFVSPAPPCPLDGRRSSKKLVAAGAARSLMSKDGSATRVFQDCFHGYAFLGERARFRPGRPWSTHLDQPA